MIKKITIITALLTLSGCSSYYEMKNCDTDKNYIKSNPEAIENYKKLFKNGDVKSYYLKITPTESCADNKCLSYNTAIYNFQERYFDDRLRKGIYTITISNDPDGKNCIKKEYSNDENCYIVTKNNNNTLKSRFQLELSFDNGVMHQKFIDLKDNIFLYDASIKRYHIPNLMDVPNSEICDLTRSPSNYKFSIMDYPYN